MEHIVDKKRWLKADVAQIRAVTHAIDTTIDPARIPKNLKEIIAIARRAKLRFFDFYPDLK